MATSEILLEETPLLKLTAWGRKSGRRRSVQVWFAYEDGRVLLLAHEDSNWWKNVKRNPRVEVEASEILFQGNAKLTQEKLVHTFELFRRKYGSDQIDRWYSGERSKRRVVEVELGRVLGKRPQKLESSRSRTWMERPIESRWE